MSIKPKLNSFGDTLKKHRAKRGLTLADLGKRARVSAAYLSEMERGRRLPSAGMLRALAAALTVSEATLTAAVIESWAWDYQAKVGEYYG